MVTSDSTLARRACASTAREVTGAGAFRRRLDDAAAMADPRYRSAFLDWLACAVRRRGGARRAGGPGAGRPGGGAGHRRPRARLRRHLPARHRAPERADRSGGAGGGRRARPRRRRGARRVRRRVRGDGALARAEPPGALRPRLPPHRGVRRRGGGRGRGAADAARREHERSAVAIALLRRGRAAGRVRVGRQVAPGGAGAAAAGVRAARLAEAGARVPLEAAARGFAQATGGAHAEPGPRARRRSTRTGSRPGPAASRRTGRSRPPARVEAGEPAWRWP